MDQRNTCTTTVFYFLMIIIVTNCQPDYHHMAFVIQWPPTLCGFPGVRCKPGDMFRFTVHGLWPGNSTGHSLKCELPSLHSEGYVKDVWEKDAKLAKDLHKYWPTLLYGNTDEEFWMYEWEAHGYCAKQTLPATDYFRGAMRVAHKGQGQGKGKDVLGNVRNYLARANMLGSNDVSYKMEDIVVVLYKVTPTNLYISCTPKNATHVFLKEIHFCLDKTLKTFVDCPASLDTRGCGGQIKQGNVFIPNKAIYD